MTSFRPLVRASAAACGALLALAGGLSLGDPAQARGRHHGHAVGAPVVVELYTAQGCSNCTKANGVVGDLANRKDILPLTFSVDYWDYLGWEDTLAKSEFATRQRAYVQRLKVREIYTPEIVVGGAAEGPAVDGKTIDGLIKTAVAAHHGGPHIHLLRHATRVQLGGPGAPAEVWLVRYDPKDQTVRIKSGENKGKTVVVHNAVRELKRLGVWHGKSKTYPIPAAEDEGLKTVVLVQIPKGGRILAMARG